MTWKNPLYLQNPAYTYAAQDDRFIIDTLFSEGVMNVASGQGLAVQRPAGANMSVYVPPLDVIIKGDDNPLQGSYLARMTDAEFVNVAAPSTTNPRIDLLVAEVVDAQYKTPTTVLLEGVHLRMVAGTPAATPTVPTLPATAIPLAQVTVPANAVSIVNANIVDLRKQSGQASLNIGTAFVRMTTAQRDAITSPVVGQSIFNTDTLKNETYVGASLGWISGARVDAQVFTASGTWTKPNGASLVFVDVVGAGGSGATGSTSPGGSGAAASGGAGGGGGARFQRLVPASSLPSTCTVTVGAGGVTASPLGGAQQGVAGGSSLFNTFFAGGGGGGMVNNSQNAGGSGGSGQGYPASPNTSAGQFATGPIGGANTNGQLGITVAEYGGGGGAGILQTSNTIAGGNSILGGGGGGGGGFAAQQPGSAGGSSGGSAGGLGSSGAVAPVSASPGLPGTSTTSTVGSGGGGGGSASNNSASPGGSGGAGGIPGGGGGGGGYGAAASASNLPGAGGAGARGEVRVYTICV